MYTSINKSGVLSITKETYNHEKAFFNSYFMVFTVFKYLLFSIFFLVVFEFIWVFTHLSQIEFKPFLLIVCVELIFFLGLYVSIQKLTDKLYNSKIVVDWYEGIHSYTNTVVKKVTTIHGFVRNIKDEPHAIIEDKNYFEVVLVNNKGRRIKAYIDKELYDNIYGLNYTFKLNKDNFIVSAY